MSSSSVVWNGFQISGGRHIYLVSMKPLPFLGFVPCSGVHITTPTTDLEVIPAQKKRTHKRVEWWCCVILTQKKRTHTRVVLCCCVMFCGGHGNGLGVSFLNRYVFNVLLLRSRSYVNYVST